MIYLKIILACLLAVIPFILARMVKRKEDGTGGTGALYTLAARLLPVLGKIGEVSKRLAKKMREGMRRHDSFRKFFILITMLVMIVYQYVDSSAAMNVASIVQDSIKDRQAAATAIMTYGSMMTKPSATVLAAVYSLSFFSYRAADSILSFLGRRARACWMTAVVTTGICLLEPRMLILAEMAEITLLAAYLYPEKLPEPKPRMRKRFPGMYDLPVLRNAA